MKAISVNDLKPGNAFTEDSFILNDLFFLPKNLPLIDYHIKLLNNWEIADILSEGDLSKEGMKKIIAEQSILENATNKTLEKESLVKSTIQQKLHENNDNFDDSFQTNINRTALLDGNIKNFFELYKSWIKKIIKIFNDVLINNIDKDYVHNFILEIINTVNKNRNNALMLFGEKFEGIFYVYTQTIETIILAYIIGDGLKLSQLSLSNLAMATLFHDIGMLKISKSILDKKDKLTDEEIKIVQNHTNIGYKYLRAAGYSAIIASGALQHHERMDGKGYPSGLLPDKVTGIAKIISVVDAYCAAISVKPFKESTQHAKEVIQDLLRQGGTAYDPAILKELIKNISFYPIGSLVLLSINKPARVVGTSGIAMKPIVKTIDESGEGKIINLSKTNDVYIKGLYTKKEG